jgi:HAD superfamily hydrolase (TIGR01509 family)
MIEFVYFDLGNILWSFDEDRACSNAAELLGVAPESVRAAVYGSGLQTRFEHGQITPQDFVDELLASLLAITKKDQTHELPFPLVLDALSDMFTPIESMVDIIASVQASGKRIGVLSNTCHAHWDWIDRRQHALMVGPKWDAVVLSFQVNSMKPDDQIYRAAELVASVPADRISFLDDKAENVRAAKLRGWRAEQCLGGEQAAQALAKHDVLG